MLSERDYYFFFWWGGGENIVNFILLKTITTVIPLLLVGCMMIIANPALRELMRLVGNISSHIQRALVG